MSRTRWSASLALAARLGIAPDVFWRLSVAEWRALTSGLGAEPLSRGDLEQLMHDHPDA